LCCRFPSVPELDKPVNVWCKHCTVGTGCSIYPDRPESCQKYECMWFTNENWPEELRPDRCRVMFEYLNGTDVIAALSTRGNDLAWQKFLVHRQILRFTKEGYGVVIRAEGGKRHLIIPKGKTPQQLMKQIDEFYQQPGVLKEQNDSASIHDRPDDAHAG
jgi:hypothetical protein